MTDIDLNNKPLSIGRVYESTIYSFKGNFWGNDHTIGRAVAPLFGLCSGATVSDLTITFETDCSFGEYGWSANYSLCYDFYPGGGGLAAEFQSGEVSNVHVLYSCNVTVNSKNKESEENEAVFGGLVGQSRGHITDCSVTFDGSVTYEAEDSYGYVTMGGLVGVQRAGEPIERCQTSGGTFVVNSGTSSIECKVGGLVGNLWSTGLVRCSSDLDMQVVKLNGNSEIGGVCGLARGDAAGNTYIRECLYSGGLAAVTNYSTVRFGGLVGRMYGYVDVVDCLFQGVLDAERVNGTAGGLFGQPYSWDAIDQKTATRCVSNGTIVGGLTADRRLLMRANAQITAVSCVGNWQLSSEEYVEDAKGTTLNDEQMKNIRSYIDWTDFEENWIINSKVNNGYPMLRAFVDTAKVTGFDGSGSSDSPYLIQTYQDLLGMASYYNDNPVTESNIYWKLANNIDVNKDANNALIHFTPICYDKEFDGYFDGNNCTISGLLIDKQYEYAGLFGRIASGSYVKNLTVTGDIYWDQAYAVGGVAGRVMSGGYLSGCTFTGNIIGVLDTKPSTECNGVVGKYEVGGAVDCSATYVDMKYAQIGGTTTAPTYTYYLYDWARITTNLYDKQA